MPGDKVEKGIVLNKIIDNSNKVVGPVLIQQGHPNLEKISSEEHGIFQPGANNLIDKIIKVISHTKQFLCVSSFLIQDSSIIDEIRKCYERGVRVYILTAAETQLSNPNEEDDSPLEKRKSNFRDMLNNLSSHALIHTGDDLHAKFIISDPKTNPKAIVFTSNLTLRALTENIELAIELSGKFEVEELFKQFLYGFWKAAKREVNSSNKELSAVNQHPEFVDLAYTPQRIKWTLGNQLLIKDLLGKMIESAESYISISTWTIDMEHPIAMQLIKKASEGVKVILFTRPHSANKEFTITLIKNGGTVYCHKLLHAKSLIVDGKQGLIMTANISKLGLDEGFETAVILCHDQINVLNKIHNEWKHGCQYRSEKTIILGDIKVPWINITENFEELPKPGVKDIDLGQVTAKKLRDYFDEKIEDYLPDNNQKNVNDKQINYTINLLPPRLPTHLANPKIEEKNDLEIYTTNNGKYICVKNREHMSNAEDLSKKINAKIVLCDK
jgi:phosphatidylserine/phosphatidylglycerophosphate/cardiolipin synthase-like enzyme